MIYGLVLVVHILVALFLVAVILLQGGRGGLGEALGGAAAQSLFGGGANTVMTRITAVAAASFMATCLSLAMLSTRQGRSVIEQVPISSNGLPAGLPLPSEQPQPPGNPQSAPPSAPTPSSSSDPAPPGAAQ